MLAKLSAAEFVERGVWPKRNQDHSTGTETVPNIDEALSTMLDVEHSIVEMDGRAVAEIDWTGGLQRELS